MAEKQLQPFRDGTRQKQARIGSVAFANNSNAPSIELPRVGYLQGIYLNLEGTMNAGAASALTDLGAWSILNRIRVNSNIGSATLFDCTGYGAYILGAVEEFGFLADKAGIGDTTPSADVYAAATANGNNTWNLWWYIPISANDGEEFESGLINLQAQETRITIDVQFGQASDAITVVGTGFTGTLTAHYNYYEVPPLGEFEQPQAMLVRRLEEQTNILNTGDTIYTIPKGGVLMSLSSYVRVNAARSDAIDYFRLKFNKTDTVYDIARKWLKFQNRKDLRLNMPTGVYHLNFWNSGAAPNTGDMRDFVDTEDISTLEWILGITSGTVLGANNNTFNTIRTIVQVLEG